MVHFIREETFEPKVSGIGFAKKAMDIRPLAFKHFAN
jgi:hypothetical protein